MIKSYFLVLAIAAFTFISCGGSSDESDEKNDKEKSPSVNNQANSIPSSGLKIAFVYMDTINIKYKLIPIIEEEIIAKQKEVERNLEALQNKALAWEKAWQAKGGPLSSEQEQYMREMQGWQGKIGQAQQDAQLTISQIQSQKMMQAQQRMSAIMQEYANENGFDFIISYQLGGQVYAVNPAYNVTSDILERLNADVDKVAKPE